MTVRGSAGSELHRLRVSGWRARRWRVREAAPARRVRHRRADRLVPLLPGLQSHALLQRRAADQARAGDRVSWRVCVGVQRRSGPAELHPVDTHSVRRLETSRRLARAEDHLLPLHHDRRPNHVLRRQPASALRADCSASRLSRALFAAGRCRFTASSAERASGSAGRAPGVSVTRAPRGRTAAVQIPA